jgi:hypothetical protein
MMAGKMTGAPALGNCGRRAEFGAEREFTIIVKPYHRAELAAHIRRTLGGNGVAPD